MNIIYIFLSWLNVNYIEAAYTRHHILNFNMVTIKMRL